MSAAAGPEVDPPRIVFYDGVCGLCNKLVQVMVALDREGRFRYAALQGDTAQRLQVIYPELPTNLDSMAYLEEGRVYVRARAIMQAAGQLRFPYSLPYFFRWVPLWLADPIYKAVAAVRYRLFGKYDTCRLPTPEERALFLP